MGDVDCICAPKNSPAIIAASFSAFARAYGHDSDKFVAPRGNDFTVAALIARRAAGCSTLAIWLSVARRSGYAQFSFATRVRMVRRVSQREGVMALKSSWLRTMHSGRQRFAAGIDVGSQNVRLVVREPALRAHAALCISST